MWMIVALVIGSQNYLTYIDNKTHRPVVFKTKEACENIKFMLEHQRDLKVSQIQCVPNGVRASA